MANHQPNDDEPYDPDKYPGFQWAAWFGLRDARIRRERQERQLGEAMTVKDSNPDFGVEWALSLTQPWATLCALEEKGRETRCWPTKFRGWIAIHAAKGFPGWCQRLMGTPRFQRALAKGGYCLPGDLPRGQVLAVMRLTECIATRVWTPPPDSDEYAFGDYSAIDGENGKPRYSFKFEEVRRLREPFECKGALGIWKLPRLITTADLV